MSVVLIGLSLACASTVAAAQGRGRGQARAGRAGIQGGVGRAGRDSTRSRKMDSLHTARRDSVRARMGSDTARAGRGRAGGRGKAGNAHAALAGLKLSDAQKNSMKDIQKRYGAELKQLRDQNGTGQSTQTADARARMKSIAERERADMRAVLTPDQRSQFDANVAKHRGGKGAGGRARKKPTG